MKTSPAPARPPHPVRLHPATWSAALSSLAFYAMLNFDAPANRKLQTMVGSVAMVVVLGRSRRARAELAHLVALSWILGSAFVFARATGTAEYGVRLASAAITPVAIVTAVGPARALRAFTTTVVVSSLTSVLLAVLVPSIGVMPDGSEWRGLFMHKNTFGFTCGLTVIACLGELGGGSASRARRQFLLLGLGSAVLNLTMARSATAVAATVFAAGLTILLGTFSGQRRSPGVTGLATCLSLSPIALMLAAPDRIIGALGRDGTLTGRSDIWRLVSEAQSRSEHPWLGRGLAFWSAQNDDAVEIWSRLQWTPFSSHNSYLDWWLLLGVVGIAILTWWVVSTSFHAARASTHVSGFASLLPLTLFVMLSSISEQYLISANGIAVLALMSAIASRFAVADPSPLNAKRSQ